jgi:hypothetical protein
MPKNQLFRQIPPPELCTKVLHTFGLRGFTDATYFSRKDLHSMQCVELLTELKDELGEYYLPCKARTYLNDLNSKNVITVLRQVARLYGYSVQSREKYIKGDKFIIYQVVPSNNQVYQPMTISSCAEDEQACIVTFD